jgi:SpoIID/LytB domain protein
MTTHHRSPIRRIAIVIATMTTVIAGIAVPPASAQERTIDIDGSGWGHGVGMSQYGAYGRAVDGQGYVEILESYYTGATVGDLGVDVENQGPLAVNVASDRTSTTLTVLDGPGDGSTGMVLTHLTDGDVQPTVTMFTGDTATVVDTTPDPGAPGGCRITLSIGGVETIWEPAGLPSDCSVAVELVDGSVQPDHLVRATNCRRPNDCTYGWGERFLLVDNGHVGPEPYERSRADTIGGGCTGCPEYEGFDIVVELSLDDYVRGIAEVPYSWPSEALKTQAVAARSYAASFALDSHRDEGCFCDVRNDSSWQVFAGWIGDRAQNGNWIDAADATAGEVMVGTSSDIVRAYYSSSNGGATEWITEKWGGTSPYFESVPDPWSLVSANPRRAWTFTEDAEEIIDRVWGTGSTLDLIGAEVVATNVSGSARTVRFSGVDADGEIVTRDVGVGSVASWFGLYSWYFSIDDGNLGPVGFADIAGSLFEGDIEYLADRFIAVPCADGPNQFCPDDRMRREDLAAFMVRALDLPPSSTDYFTDDDGLPYEDDINALRQAGITRGCNPPDNTRFCPDDTVTRGQTAAFIVRAWSLTDPGPGDWFTDDDDSIFEGDIDRLRVAGITRGCNPPDNSRYCPDRLLTRGEMSAFLARALRDLPAP